MASMSRRVRKFDLNLIGQSNLRQLPGLLFKDIRQILSMGFPDVGWKKIALVMDGNFELIHADIIEIEQEENPAESFLLFLGKRGMTIQQFVHYAGQAQLYNIIDLFINATVPAVITSQPFHEMNVCEGESLEMKIEANGTPPPFYQWFKSGFGPVPGATSNTIFFASVRLSDSGTYNCLVNNSPDGSGTIHSSPVRLSVSRAKPMEIREHPNSFTVSRGANVFMTCDVWGEGLIQYQWMKDKEDLVDGARIEGSQTNELRFRNVDSREWTGLYSCRITRNEEVIYTNDAVLQLNRGGVVRQYNATDKVALLMGAGDYRSDQKLRAPEKDIATLAKIFVSLNFKVVSLYNMTKLEMEAAIDEFKHLVGEGVYCIFYFCGHGFEASSHCFLVPPDAPQGYDHTHCLSADDILYNIILPRKPKVCCMILDICRKNRESPTRPKFVHSPIETGNYFVCYSTSQGLSAYEERNHGILVSHLKNILIEDMGIEAVFQKLREDISQNPKLKLKSMSDKKIRQIPESRTNLSEPERSFHDQIDYTGYTTAYTSSTDIWERAHEKPPDRDIVVPFEDFNVKIRLTFQQEFSNVLKIYTSVTDPGPTFSCQAHISHIPLDVAPKAKVILIKSGTKKDLCQNYLTLYDIQRLRTDLMINITIISQTEYGIVKRKVLQENLGLPLVSRLKLWQERSIVTGPGELEVEEEYEEDDNCD